MTAMSWYETPPFERGKTWMNAFPPTFDPLDQVGSTGFYTPALNYEGKVYMFSDTIYGTGVPVIVRCVRNNSGQQQTAYVQGAGTAGTGFNMAPGRLVVFDPAFVRQRVCQYSILAGAEAYPVDELLPTVGVSPGDLFYIVISGPALVYTGGATMNATISIGDWVAAASASVTQSATSVVAGQTDGGGIASLTGITTTVTASSLIGIQFRTLGRFLNTATNAFTSATTMSSAVLTANQTNTTCVIMVESPCSW
jgi:hypothetical protein